MTLAITLGLAAALIAVLIPQLLLGPLATAGPRAMVALWLGSIAAFFLLAASAVVVAAWPRHAPGENLTDVWIRCLSSAQHTMRPWVSEIVISLAVTVAVCSAVRVAVISSRHRRSRLQVLDYHHDIVTVLARPGHQEGPYPVLWLDHPLPFAYSIAGNPGFVVATEGLKSCLTSSEAQAVLDHERAHLNGRHHRILALCEVLASALPFVPLMTHAPTAIAALVELDADQTAATATSPAVLRSALSRVIEQQSTASLSPGQGCTARTQTTTDRRLRTLAGPLASHPTALAYTAYAVMPAAISALTAVTTMAALSALFCTIAS
ncbi:M56 family metallopeptidase [Williamsia sp. D3]|nr:M56 family metallopeptidase [Williamsia sp. D3]ETD33823.1 peptidase M48 [Williamsia sp. D3]PVY24598.1 peptidase M48-like protein [Williamsia marianensis]